MKDKKAKYKRHQEYKMRKSIKRRRHKKKPHKIKVSTHTKSVMVKRVKEMPTNSIAQILEYDALFGKLGRPKLLDILKLVPRDMVINIAGVLTDLYGMAGAVKLNMFFSSKSNRNRTLVRDLLWKFENTMSPKRDYFWTTSETPKQLLRHAFSIPTDQVKARELSEEDAELLIFKAILLLNQENTHYKIRKEIITPTNMLFLLSVMNMNMHGDEEQSRKDRSIMQLYFAVQFFQMLETLDEYRPLLGAFMNKHGVNYWNEYIRSIFGVLAMNNYKPAKIPGDLRNDENHLVNKVVLDTIAMPWDELVKYKSDGPEDRSGNTDYKEFRNRPLIVLGNGDYVFNSWEFVVDRLFNSLYFEFKELNVPKKLLGKVNGLFTDKFSEKHLFDQLVEMSASKKKYDLITEDKMNDNYPKEIRKDGELGPPDYLLQNDKACIIFECKDVRIGGDEIETHDFDVIVDIFSNKLYQKRWRYKDGVKEYLPDDKDKRIGITQLTDHIAKVRAGSFKYANVNEDKRIYPVLILSDYKNLHRGFNHIANNWYMDSLDSLTSRSVNNRPLIVMSFITLIKYHDLFTKYGFESYFEDYYKVMFASPRDMNEAMTVNMSFDDFMGRHGYDLTPMHKELMKVVTRGVK